jgi:hypothetical protein
MALLGTGDEATCPWMDASDQQPRFVVSLEAVVRMALEVYPLPCIAFVDVEVEGEDRESLILPASMNLKLNQET